MTAETSKVPFSSSTVGQCLCPGCPVQAKSSCVADLKKGLEAALARNPLQREDIPGPYCSTGKATCTDLDPSQRCLCWGCSIFAQYSLANGQPVDYYCRDGASG